MKFIKNKKHKHILFSIIILIIISSISISSIFINKNKFDPNVHAQTTLNTSWPQLQYDANHSGYLPQTIKGPYTILWSLNRPFPISYRVQPIIAENKVFLGSNNNSVYALSTSNGATVWSYATLGPLVNTLGYDTGIVYVGSTDHYIYALDASNGSLIWKYQTEGTVRTAPVIGDNKVFMGSSDGYMYALNKTTGALVWKYNTGMPIYDTAAYDNGKLFFGSMNSKAYGLNTTTGTELWTPIQTKGQGFRDRWTVAGNGKAFFTPMLSVSGWDVQSDGTVMFHADANPVIYNQPWSTQKTAILNYLSNNPYSKSLYVVDETTGTEPYTAPVLRGATGSQSEHSQVVLLPNGNANLIYRRSMGEPSQWGATTNDALYTGELNLSTGDIASVDICLPLINGACNSSKRGPYISDESSSLSRTGNVITMDSGRGTVGYDTTTQTFLSNPYIGKYNSDFISGTPTVVFTDYISQGGTNSGGGWLVDFSNLYSEMDSDGNDIKRPTPVVGDTYYILVANILIAVKGTVQ